MMVEPIELVQRANDAKPRLCLELPAPRLKPRPVSPSVACVHDKAKKVGIHFESLLGG